MKKKFSHWHSRSSFHNSLLMALVLTDVWMMSQLSVSALAAGGLGASVYSFIFIIASSCVGCVANLIAIAYGQRIARPDFGNQQIRFCRQRSRITIYYFEPGTDAKLQIRS